MLLAVFLGVLAASTAAGGRGHHPCRRRDLGVSGRAGWGSRSDRVRDRRDRTDQGHVPARARGSSSGSSYIPYVLKPTRAQVLQLREPEFIDAPVTGACSNMQIMFRELLPNVALDGPSCSSR